MSKGGQKPTAHFNPSGRKQAALGRIPSSNREKPSWRFARLDDGGEFCWRQMTQPDVERALKHLQNFESMTWAEIEGPHSHYLGQGALTREAIARLTVLKLDDQIDQVFSLRITSAARVVGIRRDAVFYLLWWDRTHDVAESSYKK